MQALPTLAERGLLALVGPATNPSAEIEMCDTCVCSSCLVSRSSDQIGQSVGGSGRCREHVLDAFARLGSLTAAAKELHYTQPTVSHHLARLEAETGAGQLLLRDRTVVPRAVATLNTKHPGLQISLTGAQPPEAH